MTRKIVHILVGFEWVILYYFLSSSIHTVIICVVFTILLLLSYLKKMLPMMSSDSENDPGTVYYGVAMTVMALIGYFNSDFMLAFGIGVFCTSVGDGFAGVFGSLIKKRNFKLYNGKTLVGTLSAFVFSFLSVIAFSEIFNLKIPVYYSATIALISSGIELISRYGLDNIFIPIFTSVASYYIILAPASILPYIVPIALTPYVIAAVLSKKLLTVKGVIIAVAMDVIVSVAFQNFGFVYLLSFLALSVAVDKIKKHFKNKKDEITRKGEHRDEFQVLANGLFPVIMAILYICTGEYAFAVAYCAGLAEAFSDTCASGFGMLSDKTYDVLTLKRISTGLSGGVSIVGTAASLLAAFVFPCIALAFGVIEFSVLPLVALCAFSGNVFDSVFGSLLQAKFKCTNCGIITEKTVHCESNTVLYKGARWISNDIVNFASTAFSSSLAAILYFLIL